MPPSSWAVEMRRRIAVWLPAAIAALSAVGALAAEDAPQVANPVGYWNDYEMIIQADMPLRGTLRQGDVGPPAGGGGAVNGQSPDRAKPAPPGYVGRAGGTGGSATQN